MTMGCSGSSSEENMMGEQAWAGFSLLTLHSEKK